MKFGISTFFILVGLAGCHNYQLGKKQESNQLASASSETCQYIQNSKGQLVSWKYSVPVTFYISSQVPEIWRHVIQDAARAWTSPTGAQLIQVQTQISSSVTSANDGQNVVYWTTTGNLLNHQQAQTTTRWTQNQIVDADIQINAKDFGFYEDIPENSQSVHLKSLLVHEFGHAIGLRHVPVMSSVMYPDLQYAQVRVDLAKADVESVKCEY